MPIPRQKTPEAIPDPLTQPVSLGGPFTLQDPEGKKWTEKDFPHSYLVIYFGYTFCPDICPMALHHLTDAIHMLESKGGLTRKIQPLFITLDPERDTPSSLKEYMTQFHPSIKGLTGSPPQIEAVLKAYRVYRSKFVPDPKKPEYLMDHSSLIYIMSPEGTYLGSFSHQTDPTQMASLIQNFIEKDLS